MTRGMVALVAVTVMVLAAGGAGPATAAEVVGKKIPAAETPQLDGKADKVWDSVRATRIPVAEGTIGKVDVTMKVLYTDTDIFFLLQWPDKTMSQNRMWEFDGTAWKRAKGDEDRLSIMWDTGNAMAGFQRRGCADVCHQKDRVFSLRTNSAAERADLWQWKAQRTNPVGQVEKQTLVNELQDMDGASTGRRRDAKATGGYEPNRDQDGKRPRYTFRDGTKPGPVLTKDAAVEIKDHGSFKKGDRVPLDIVAPFAKGGAEIQAGAAWERGRWTLELKRARKTADELDIQFTDDRPHHFGLAVHDDSAGDDHSHTTTSVYKLLLK